MYIMLMQSSCNIWQEFTKKTFRCSKTACLISHNFVSVPIPLWLCTELWNEDCLLYVLVSNSMLLATSIHRPINHTSFPRTGRDTEDSAAVIRHGTDLFLLDMTEVRNFGDDVVTQHWLTATHDLQTIINSDVAWFTSNGWLDKIDQT